MKSISVNNEVLMCSIIAQWGHEFLCKGCVFIYHSGKRQIRAWANINNQLACLTQPMSTKERAVTKACRRLQLSGLHTSRMETNV